MRSEATRVGLESPLSRLRTLLLRRFLQFVHTERSRVYALTLLIGFASGLTALAFHSSIRWASQLLIERALAQPRSTWIAWALIVPTSGALIAGVLLEYVLPDARGSGIPQVKFIYAVKSGRLRLRDAVGKFALATLQLGSGAALGREGPTVQICASVASALGRLFAVGPANLRRLIPVGAAAGIAAAFNAPIAAVTFTIEEIVGDLDQTVLAGVVVAAALAAAVEHSILGGHPVFSVPDHYAFEHASSLMVYALLGAAAALLSRLFYLALLSLRGRVRRLSRVQRALAPALGGLGTGVLAVLACAWFGAQGVLGDGYASLSAALAGDLPVRVMAVLVVAKFAATVLCYSSGGAGGIFAPVLFVGGMLGGIFGQLDRTLLDHPSTEIGAFALVGMGAFFAAVIRAPLTSVLIIFEMTRSYELILPLMIANTVAYTFARGTHRLPIYEALLEQDGLRLPQLQRTAAALSSFQVSDVMTTELVTLAHDDSVIRALERIQGLPFTMYPVVRADRHIAGLVSEAKLRRCMADGRSEELLEKLARAEDWLKAEEPLGEAVIRMNALGARQMAVVDPTGQLVGVLAMSDVVRAHARAAQEIRPDDPRHGMPSLSRPAVLWAARDTSVPITPDSRPS
jgi:CIC family chloride channel protein